jgi:hypothetical protein
VIIRIGIKLRSPLVLQIFILSSERYRVQRILQDNSKIKIKTHPETSITILEVDIIELRLLLILLRMASIGVYIYLANI